MLLVGGLLGRPYSQLSSLGQVIEVEWAFPAKKSSEIFMKMLVENLATIGNESEWLNAYETLKDNMVLGESNAF